MSKPKYSFIGFFTLGFLFLTLPLFGFGCTSGQSAPSVSEKADTVQTDKDITSPQGDEKPAPTDEKPDTKPTAQDDDSASDTPASQSELPEGWKWYKSKKYKIEFGYPGEWYHNERVSRDGQRVMTDFDTQPKFPTETERFHPIWVDTYAGDIVNVVKEWQAGTNADQWSQLTLGGRTYEVSSATNEMSGDTQTFYLTAIDGGIIELVSASTTKDIAEKMLSTLTQGDLP